MAKGRLPSALIAIADCDRLGAALPGKVALAYGAGVECVLLRGPSLTVSKYKSVATEVVESCPGLSLIIHSYREVAAGLSCYGVHMPSHRLGELARVSEGLLRGGSCHDGEELERAAKAGADYVFLSPVFPPTSKPHGGPTLGWSGFSSLAKGCGLKVYALGGMGIEKVADAAANGAAGVAVLGDIFDADDVSRRAARWVKAMNELNWE